MRTKIYVASSWRNKYFDEIVELLSKENDVYNFKEPFTGTSGFHWNDIDPSVPRQTHGSGPLSVSPTKYKELLDSPRAKEGHTSDKIGMEWADICVAVMPFGRSASLEVGWFLGKDKPVYLYIPEPLEPELMFRDCKIVLDKNQLEHLPKRTCPYKGCSAPFSEKPPCELRYE